MKSSRFFFYTLLMPWFTTMNEVLPERLRPGAHYLFADENLSEAYRRLLPL